MKTLSIRVPYARGIIGLVGTDDAAGKPEWHVLVRLHPGADVERFEDAAATAEGDLAAALLLRRQAELALAAGLPWFEATERLRAECLQASHEARDAAESAAQVAAGKQNLRRGGDNSSETRLAQQSDALAQVAPLFAAARAALLAKGRKRPGAKWLMRTAKDALEAGDSRHALLTKHYANIWLASIRD